MMVAISKEMQAALAELARLRGMGNTIDALRKAVAVDLFLMRQLRVGNKLLLQERDGSTRSVDL